jgi:hypothetical protein
MARSVVLYSVLNHPITLLHLEGRDKMAHRQSGYHEQRDDDQQKTRGAVVQAAESAFDILRFVCPRGL